MVSGCARRCPRRASSFEGIPDPEIPLTFDRFTHLTDSSIICICFSFMEIVMVSAEVSWSLRELGG